MLKSNLRCGTKAYRAISKNRHKKPIKRGVGNAGPSLVVHSQLPSSFRLYDTSLQFNCVQSSWQCVLHVVLSYAAGKGIIKSIMINEINSLVPDFCFTQTNILK